ncbi:MAG: nucleotidyltransferase family protein [Gammaproteobacteria bacterium]
MLPSAPEWDLAEARRIVLSKLRGYRAQVFLFGSRASGGAGCYSDIDIGILPGEALPVGLLAELREALEESRIIYAVDVIDLSEVSDIFRSRVICEGVRWNE